MNERSVITSCLMPGETILWTGVPARGIRLFARDIVLIPFSLLWGGMALNWENIALRNGDFGIGQIVGAVFAAIGLFMIAGRFFFDAWLRGQTVYGVTNLRVLVVRKGPMPSHLAKSLYQVDDVNLLPLSGGRGTIQFEASSTMGMMRNRGATIWIPSLDPGPQFIAIEDAERVFDLIQKEIAEGRPTSIRDRSSIA